MGRDQQQADGEQGHRHREQHRAPVVKSWVVVAGVRSDDVGEVQAHHTETQNAGQHDGHPGDGPEWILVSYGERSGTGVGPQVNE